MTPSEFIKRIRLSLCATQQEFGVMIDKDPGTISMYESGKRRPSYATVKKLVQIARENGMEATFLDIRNE